MQRRPPVLRRRAPEQADSAAQPLTLRALRSYSLPARRVRLVASYAEVEGSAPRGPRGGCRPAGDKEAAALICRFTAGEPSEVYEPLNRAKASETSRKGAPADRRREIAQAARVRWARVSGVAPRSPSWEHRHG